MIDDHDSGGGSVLWDPVSEVGALIARESFTTADEQRCILADPGAELLDDGRPAAPTQASARQ